MRPADGDRASLWDLATERLIPYLADLGFTHVELLPITEHPFGGSWGYQPLGLFAPSARFGPPEAFARFVDAPACGEHRSRCSTGCRRTSRPIAHGLARFDGTALYEYLDPREGFHRDWNTYIYNFGRHEVQGFLIASALHWLERYHVDGLRVDAVASMLYRDYSRPADAWIPNIHGGRENLEAVGFLRHLNAVVAERCPGAIVVAEESTAWPGVTAPLPDGLGFSFKWNMGWMHDTLRYIEHEPIHRAYHHDDITFGLLYAFSEKFILPISHDEVVHGKGSLLGKMPGDRWQRFANLRAYLGFMWAHPGKKLLFMGSEIAQAREWNHDAELDWPLLGDPAHAGIQRLVGDLNRLYAGEPSPASSATPRPAGFRWLIGDDRANSVFAFLRCGEEGSAPVLVVCNMTPVPRHGYRIGVPRAGRWREIANTDLALLWRQRSRQRRRASMRLEQPSHGEAHSRPAHPAAARDRDAARRGLSMVSWPDRLLPGAPYPLGATWDGLGTNFAVFSAHATRLELCLFDPSGRREIAALRAAGMHRRGLARLSAQRARRADLRLSRLRPLRAAARPSLQPSQAAARSLCAAPRRRAAHRPTRCSAIA